MFKESLIHPISTLYKNKETQFLENNKYQECEENLVKLTIEQHQELHGMLYKCLGDDRDLYTVQTLSQNIWLDRDELTDLAANKSMTPSQYFYWRERKDEELESTRKVEVLSFKDYVESMASNYGNPKLFYNFSFRPTHLIKSLGETDLKKVKLLFNDD